jgi:hypothetical protein
MPFTIDFLDDGRILEWEATHNGAVPTEIDDYTARFYVASRTSDTDVDLPVLQFLYVSTRTWLRLQSRYGALAFHVPRKPCSPSMSNISTGLPRSLDKLANTPPLQSGTVPASMSTSLRIFVTVWSRGLI